MAQVDHLRREPTSTRTMRREENWTRSGAVVSRILPGEEIETLEDRAAATVADPAPMGLWGFATGTWILGVVFSGAFPAAQEAATIPVLLTFAGVAQFIAGLYAYRRANVLDSTSFCSFGTLYVLLAFCYALQARGILPTTGTPVVIEGFVLLSFAFISLALMLAAMPTNLARVGTLGLRTIGFVLAGIALLYGAQRVGTFVIGDIGGWFLVASALVAYYLGMALTVNSTWGRNVFPIWGTP